MKNLRVTVNGKIYDVQVEEVGEMANTSVSAPTSAPITAPTPVVVPVPVAAPAASSEGSEAINSPMPGTILSVKVIVGETVKNGQPIVVLEAMKMENEIVAPRDCVIVSVDVIKGQTVNSGTALVTIK